MIQITFANHAKSILEKDDSVIGLAAAGSWISQELDEFSDLDLTLVTRDKITDSKANMLAIASRLGDLLNGFTGEHVGEPRLLICLYDNPLLHVDLKFVTLEEFKSRVETPIILLDKAGELQKAIDNSEAAFPLPDFQWIEDRFWTWIHYALLKVGRGELMEAHDFMAFIRMVVLGPLLHLNNNNLPRGVRKVEFQLQASDFNDLKGTLPQYYRQSILDSLMQATRLYQRLRASLFSENILLQKRTETSVMKYFDNISSRFQ